MKPSEISALTGRGQFRYVALCSVDEPDLQKYVQRCRRHFGNLAGDWTEERNTEWLARFYLSLKMMLSAQLLIGSASYASDQNLQIVLPYLHYYTLLNTCRAFLFSSPTVEWREGTLQDSTHSKIINCVVSELTNLSQEMSDRFDKLLRTTQAIRETFSYRFPATGMNIVRKPIHFDEVFDASQLLCELAQLSSECLASALDKRGVVSTAVNESVLAAICEYEAPQSELDSDDHYRLDYLVRKASRPLDLALMATEGLTEDFFGAWMSLDGSDPEEGQFHPDRGYCGLIFDYTW